MRKGLTLLLALVTLALCAAAAAEGEFPELNAAGFLDEGTFLWEDAEGGVWRYADTVMRVEVLRHTQTDPNLVWYEAEVWTDGSVRWEPSPAKVGKYVSFTGWPEEIAQRNQDVLAVNSDYVFGRYPSKNRSVGIFIRDGKVIWSKTRTSVKNTIPNLDTLALMPDGTWGVFHCTDHTADDYIAMGCEDVLSFGPYLIKDGILNEEGYRKTGVSNAPRTAVGMVDPNHTWAVMVEGRAKASVGVPVSWLAEKLYEKGCVTAFNLDGGQTSCILFMGKQLNSVGGAKNKRGWARASTEIFAIGHSEQVHTDSWTKGW